MRRPDDPGDLGILGHGVGVVDPAGERGVVDDPLALDLGHRDVHAGDPHTPVERLDQENLLARRGIGDELVEVDVGVPDEDGVDVRDLLGEQAAGVLGVRQGVAVGRRREWAGVAGHDDDIGAGGLEARDVDLGLLDDARELRLALDVRLVPDGDAGRDQSEDADAERLLAGDLDRLDDVGREERGAGVPVDGVGAEQRVVALGVEGAQQVQAVVELVVAESGGVVADGVHGLGHGVHGSAGDGLDLGVVVRERRALDGVTGVEGDGVAGADLLADHLDEGRGLGDADVAVARVVVLGVLVVVPVVDVAVQVGGAENGERVLVLAGLGFVARGGLRRACSGDAGHADASHGGHGQQLAAGGLGLGDGAEGSGRAARHVTPGVSGWVPGRPTSPDAGAARPARFLLLESDATWPPPRRRPLAAPASPPCLAAANPDMSE